jgi:hypothetical protein
MSDDRKMLSFSAAVAADILSACSIPGGSTLTEFGDAYLAKKLKEARDAFIEEMAKGDVQFDPQDIDPLIDVIMRFSKAVADGAARGERYRNLSPEKKAAKKAYRKKYSEQYREQRRQYKKKYRETHREQQLEYYREWYRNLSPEKKEARRIHERERRRNMTPEEKAAYLEQQRQRRKVKEMRKKGTAE